MGKCSGMLLLSDYDNTFCYTEKALSGSGEAAPVNPRNLEAVRYWMAEGGRFAVATGRALAAFRRQAAGVPMNAPAIVDNGGAIYDFAQERYLVKNFLPERALWHIAALMDAFPTVSLELYHEDDLVQVMRPRAWNDQHAKLTGLGYEVIEAVTAETAPPPFAKALFVGEKADLTALRDFIRAQSWSGDYETIFSSDLLLELTARGADKGTMALKLKELCGCEKLFCVGDHANDLPMLLAADRGFAPANAIEEVRSSGVQVVCHCLDGAIADVVEAVLSN